jgi:hypothetical protein
MQVFAIHFGNIIVYGFWPNFIDNRLQIKLFAPFTLYDVKVINGLFMWRMSDVHN